MRPERGRLRQVRPKGPPLVFQYNPERVTPAGGGARYETIDRPLRRSALLYAGEDLETFAFTLFFDGYPTRSIEADLTLLRQMTSPAKKGERGPLLRFDYGPRTPDKLWVIPSDGLDWGSELRRSDLQRVRQEVTVTLLEFEAPDLNVSPIKKRRDKKGRNTIHGSVGGTLHFVTPGETLASIAVSEFGDVERWIDIAELNGIRDPRSISEGLELILPEA